jgi:hypothetical protein
MNTFWFPKTSFSDYDYVPTVYGFETTEDLLSLDSVKRFNEMGAEFVMSDEHLMVITKEGFEWWVVGRVGKPEEVDLPKWGGPKILVRFDDGMEGVVTTEIYSICGDRITLRDGSVVTKVNR